MTAAAKRAFRQWSRERETLYFGDHVPINSLCSAALISSLASDHGAWRQVTGSLAQEELLSLSRDSGQDAAVRGLQALRLSGGDEQIRLAVRRLANDGPCAAVTAVAREVDLTRSTRTTAKADIALLRYGGDLLDRATGDAAARWLLQFIGDSNAFDARTGGFVSSGQLVDALAGVLGASGPDVQSDVAEYISTMPACKDWSDATSWARVLHRLPRLAWKNVRLSGPGLDVRRHHVVLATRLLGLSTNDPKAETQLLEEASSGSLSALQALGDVTKLPLSVVQSLVQKLSDGTQQAIEEARQGKYGMGGDDYGRALAFINLWHPEAANWSPIIDLIKDPSTHPEHRQGPLQLLAERAVRIPENVRSDLLAAAEDASTYPSLPEYFEDCTDSTAEAMELITALRGLANDDSDGEVGPGLASLVRGDASSRISATRIARRRRTPLDVGVLLVLAHDDDPKVRAAAAHGLAHLALAGTGGLAAIEAIKLAVRDPGRLVPHAIAGVIGECADLTEDLAELRVQLAEHPSAMVRRAAQG